jgi:hypothetical protein
MNNGKIPTIKKSHITEMYDSGDDNETKESMLKVLLIEYKKLKDLDTKCYDILNRFFFKKGRGGSAARRFIGCKILFV